jgi:hypothetical protein
MPVFFFFGKRQVRLLKASYLSGKNKQNFEVTQWKWDKVYSSWAPGLTPYLLGVCWSLLWVALILGVFAWVSLIHSNEYNYDNMYSQFHVLNDQDLAKNPGKCCLFLDNVDQRNLPTCWRLTKTRFGMALSCAFMRHYNLELFLVFCVFFIEIINKWLPDSISLLKP